MNPIVACAFAQSALAAVALRPVAAETSGAKPPNVLFIAVDDLRPEIGCYGNKVVKTPNLDRLAARGVVFQHAYCQQAVCSPSRSSLLTGLRPDTTRVWDLDTHFRTALPDAVTLPQHFKANGYHTAALGKIYHGGFEDGASWSEPHWYPGGTTVDTDPDDWSKRITVRLPGGVTEYSPAAAPKAGAPIRGKGPKGDAFEKSPKADEELPDGYTAGEAVRRLEKLAAEDQPFFLAVGFLKPHLPFVAPAKYWDLYDPADIPGPPSDSLPKDAPSFSGHTNGELHSYANVPEGNPIPEEFARVLRHGYYACVSYVDAQIGRLLDALEKGGLEKNTIVILWGDHGWQLGDHGLWHKHTNFEIAARAPLIIADPKRPAGAGQSCAATVEFVDVYPTLADAAGLPIPGDLHGASLVPYLENPSAPSRKPAISQYPRGGAQTGGRDLMGYSIRTDIRRLTLWRDKKTNEIAATELYDYATDPDETVNIAAKPESVKVIEELSAYLPPPINPSSSKPAKGGRTPDAPAPDRNKMFERRDANGDGKLDREEFLSQPDPEAAKGRFDPFDVNKDGFLSREEFVNPATRP